MNHIFIPVREKFSRAEGKKAEYGIAVYKGFRKVAFVQNVANFSFVLCLCIKYTLHQLSPIHLPEVLDDCLSNATKSKN